MEHRHEGLALLLMPLASQLADSTFDPQQRLQGRRPCQEHQGRIHQGNLFLQPGSALLDFVGRGLSIVGWPALDHIADVEVLLFIQFCCLEEFTEKAA